MTLSPIFLSGVTASATAGPAPTGRPGGVDGFDRALAAASGNAVTVDAVPASPPDEVLAAISTAASVHDRLAGTGRSVRFDLDDASGRLSVTLTDAAGATLSPLSGAQTLALASGEPVA